MSANISNANGRDEVFVVGAPAWHNLGVNVQEAQRWQEAVRLASMGWSVAKVQLKNPCTAQDIPFWALMREDTRWVFDIVTERYQPIQNSECFDFVDALIESHDAHYVSAGALGHGEVVWVLAKLDNLSFRLTAEDEHQNYLLFTDRRDGKTATAKLCSTRIVCNNTYTLAMGEDSVAGVLRLRHTAGVQAKLKAAKGLVAGVSAQVHTLEDKFKALAAKRVTGKSFKEVLTRLFPEFEKNARQQNMAAQVAANFESNDGGAVPQVAGTGYALFNAVTQWVDHQRGGFRVPEGTNVDVRRAESALFGTGDAFKTAALGAVCGVLEVGPDINMGAVQAEIDALTK